MEIAVISGKGGTGKSSISAAFATLSEKVVLTDCDVDTANLDIIFNPIIEEEQVYIGKQIAEIDYAVCSNCGLCIDYCRFDAIESINNKVVISEISCDGCKLCSRVCPVDAIKMIDNDKSRVFTGSFRNGKMVFFFFSPGEENSGKLVNIVRDKAKQIAKENHLKTIIIDGSPGIGCPVVSSITGVNHVVIVTEPTLSGLYDLQRAVEFTSKFNLKIWIIINKHDLNPTMTQNIKNWCKQENITIAGELPFDIQIVNAMVNCKSIIEYAKDSEIAREIEKIYHKISR